MSLDEGQEDLKSRLEKQLAEMEEQRQSLVEIKSDWAEIKRELMENFQEVKLENQRMTRDIQSIKDVVLHSRLMIEDLKFKVIYNLQSLISNLYSITYNL